MTDIVSIKKINEAYVKIIADPGIVQEISDKFTYFVPGYQHMPKFRNRIWDGKIRFVNRLTGAIYAGLVENVDNICREKGFTVEYLSDFDTDEFSIKEAKDFVESLEVPNVEERDYQLKTFIHCIRHKRVTVASAVNSGKSLLMYWISQYYKKKTLIVVPTIGLVSQLANDFRSYGYDEDIHKIMAGIEKDSCADITISTWQSIYKLSEDYFDQFDVVIGDEVHLFAAKSLIDIMTKLAKTVYRFGFTGSMPKEEINKLTIEGLFGPSYIAITTSQMIDQGYSSELNIEAIILNYEDETKKAVSKMDYPTERAYIITHSKRNNFIKNLALSLDGNTLILFDFHDQGDQLRDILQIHSDNKREVHYVSGKVDIEEREDIRQIVNKRKNDIIVASVVFTTGINIPAIDNIIFASPSKARTRIIQSIGRGLRKTGSKIKCNLFDISDDFTWKSKQNTTFEHFENRLELYNEEGFPYKIYRVNLKV